MQKRDLFSNLFIFEMANNHMGSVEHGLRVIREMKEACRGHDFTFGFKLQYRDLDTFIHPDFKGREDVKYVKRFSETRLNEDELRRLKDEIQGSGFVSICTPFDERSVDLIEKHDFNVIKIASCSLTDWPLLERIAKTDKPIIASTAGVSLDSIDKVVTFLENRNKQFCLMHCVGEYPTGRENLELNQIDVLRQRYPEVPIGFSTHERPDNFDAVKIAVGKGASVFERHVGVRTEMYDLNAYSSTPEQIQQWLSAAREAVAMCTTRNSRREFSVKEVSDLRGLKRGVFARHHVKKGERIDLANAFLAIPNLENQLLANDMSKYIEFTANRDFKPNEPLMLIDLSVRDQRKRVMQIIGNVRQIIFDSKVNLPKKLHFELSHHYGIEGFEEWGATIINCINREYCKKLIIMLPGQKHPVHHHKIKEETFHVLYGDMRINLNDEERENKSGDLIVVERGVRHSFCSGNGAIFEEISTTHYKDDSFYEDERIVNNRNRKTEMIFWADWLHRPEMYLGD